jgi:uncharacterized protein YkwD
MEALAVYRFAAALMAVALLVVALGSIAAPLAASPATAQEAPRGVAAIERAVLDKVNEIRRERGLPPLAPDPALAAIARGYSCAMAERGFFDHTAPDGTTMGDRLRAAGQRYRSAGENIARIETRGDPAERAVTGWLKSPGHRENLLSKSFTTTGVGACRAGRAVYFTQVFVRPR